LEKGIKFDYKDPGDFLPQGAQRFHGEQEELD
jgi:hypothetical protein